MSISLADQLENMLRDCKPEAGKWQSMQEEYNEMLSKRIIKKHEYNLAPLQVSAPSGLIELQAAIQR